MCPCVQPWGGKVGAVTATSTARRCWLAPTQPRPGGGLTPMHEVWPLYWVLRASLSCSGSLHVPARFPLRGAVGGCRVELISLLSLLPPGCGFSGFPSSAERFKQLWAACRKVKISSVPFISAHTRALCPSAPEDKDQKGLQPFFWGYPWGPCSFPCKKVFLFYYFVLSQRSTCSKYLTAFPHHPVPYVRSLFMTP